MGLFIFIFFYFTLNAPDKMPEEKSKTNPPIQFCKLEDPDTALTFKAPADNVVKKGTDDDELLGTPISGGGCGGTETRHILGNTVTYRLIRKNVPMSTLDVKKRGFNWEDGSCHFDTAEKLGIDIPEVDKTKYKVFYPEISGEISLDKQIYSRTRGGERDLMYFIDYGLVFLLQINPDGSFTELKGGTTKGESETFYLADVYQDIDSGRPELPPESFACDTSKGTDAALKTQVISPGQDTSTTKDQLQLQYFVFNTGAKGNQVVNGWGVHCKPAVYLYPPKKQLVNVKVIPSGFLTYVDPPYDNERGWSVYAYPDGSLSTMNGERLTNNYLYFESKIRDEVIKKPEKGWVVKFDELESLYNQILPKLGLNESQTKDFVEYWKKALPESPYYFVGIIKRDNIDEIEKLEITPKPDYINRVRIYFERLDEPKQVHEPSDISLQQSANSEKAEDRQLTADSFRVVEWGGMVKNDPNHPFTCSQ